MILVTEGMNVVWALLDNHSIEVYLCSQFSRFIIPFTSICLGRIYDDNAL